VREQYSIVLLLYLVPIRDKKKQQTIKETKIIQIQLQPLYNTIALEQTKYNNIITRDLISFADFIIPVNPTILIIENDFRICRNLLS
jgi:hypothetical protein